jgi:steroid delta-isomerase-like uncharacterized protein
MDDLEAHKALVRRFFDEVVGTGRVELMESLVAADIVDHSRTPGWGPGRAGFAQHLQSLHDGISDASLTVDDLIAEGSRVVCYWTLHATHSGTFFGVPATGKRFNGTAVSLLTIEHHQIVEYSVRADVFNLLQQLGVVDTSTPEHPPAPPAALSDTSLDHRD